VPEDTENHDLSTQERLLGSAARIFARKGYHEATVAEICEAAGANIAAVNYYFRSKENLYVEAWRHAFATSAAKYPPDGGVPADAPAPERLKGYVRAVMDRIGDPECHEFEFVHKEMANPSGLLAEAMAESVEPILGALDRIVGELLGEAANQKTVALCLMSIRAQCFGPMLHERQRRTTPAVGKQIPVPPPLPTSVDEYADHVVRFSLAGVEAIRRQFSQQAEETP
jgi:AcrR family transcriptional regulator